MAGGDGGGDMDTRHTKPWVSLDPEWAELAKKQLKGADPGEKLTWRTAEVSEIVCKQNYLVIIICMCGLSTTSGM